MDYFTFGIVILAATMHALWNLGTKKTKMDRLCLLWLAHLHITLFSSPFVIYELTKTGLNSAIIPYLILTGLFHAGYMVLLGWAYHIGEISFVYPVSRGLSIVGTSLLATLIGVDNLSVHGIIGVCIIATGIMIVGNSSNNHHESKATLAAVCLGVATSLYSIVDKMAVMHMSSWVYCALTFYSTAVVLSGYIMLYKPTLFKTVTMKHIRRSGFLGAMMFSTYSIILYAFQHAPASYVVALRETSIAIATILGVIALKESSSIRKFSGVAILLIGAVVIKLV